MEFASIRGFGIVPETLTEDNYEHWKRCLKLTCLLAMHGWTYLADKASRPHPATPSRDHEDEEEDGDGQFKHNGMREHLYYEPLYRAIEENDWKATEEFLQHNPNAVKARVSSHKDTALHIAILSGHIEIAQKLLSKMEPGDLELINEYGATALSLAAVCGAKKLAKAIVNKNRHLVKLENGRDDGELPVIVAALYGQNHIVRYLYKVTPIYVLSPENGVNGVRLLNCLITADIYDIASLLLKRYPKLGVTPDGDGDCALKILAHKPSAFPSGTKFAFWEKLIYKCARIHSPWDRQQDGEEQKLGNDADQIIEIHESSEDEIVEIEHGGLNITSRVHRLFHELGWGILRCLVPEIKYIHQKKLVHDEAVKLLSCMFGEIRKLSNLELENMDIDTIIYDAIKHGIIEFICEMLKYKPDIIWKKDKIGRTIFAHAIVLRQEKIFSLIYGLGTRMRIMARRHDIFRNNYLHLAAKLSPPSQLERVSGAALQMQRELQWFKEVESIVQPKLKEEVNENSKKPETLFSDEHKKLATDAERWMKNTAGSSMIVGTLIAAVMFTTAFTVPGGNDDKTGLPIMFKSHPHPFLIFMVSNALSMFSSTTSLLMFLGILTARYAEEDFLTSLPTKLIFGLASLFFSIVTMMSSFGAALYLTLHHQLHWITIPIIIFSVIPIALFSICQFPLLIEMTNRTYGSGIFDKPKKTDLQLF